MNKGCFPVFRCIRHAIAIALVVLLCAFARAEIIESSDHANVLLYAQPGDWVVIDLDFTTWVQAQTFASDVWFDKHLESLIKSGMNERAALEATRELFWRGNLVTSTRLTEAKLPEIIRNIQAQGINIIGFTARGPGIAELTLKDLARHGIDFRASAPALNVPVFRSSYDAVYMGGVLFCNGPSKDGPLGEFLAQTSSVPRRIVHIDDKVSHLNRVGRLLSEKGIEYLGQRYGGVDHLSQNYNPEVAELQHRDFLRSGMTRIMSDAEALERLQGALLRARRCAMASSGDM